MIKRTNRETTTEQNHKRTDALLFCMKIVKFIETYSRKRDDIYLVREWKRTRTICFAVLEIFSIRFEYDCMFVFCVHQCVFNAIILLYNFQLDCNNVDAISQYTYRVGFILATRTEYGDKGMEWDDRLLSICRRLSSSYIHTH